MSAGPGILEHLKSLGSTVADAAKSRYLSGPPVGAPSAGPGSVLDQHVSQVRAMTPTPSTSQSPVTAPPSPSTSGHALYGSRVGEKRIDTSEMTKPLGGLNGLQRK